MGIDRTWNEGACQEGIEKADCFRQLFISLVYI